MLFDLLHALATPAPLDHRRLGCVGDSIRTGSRARRCRAAWVPHLAATRAAIEAAVTLTPGRRTCVVLGSGRLDDVPLAVLAAAFARVVLVDAVHPWAARRAVRRHANVASVTADLGGSFGLLLGRADALAPGLPAVCSAAGTDLVVSANLLSQLPIRPVERLEHGSRALGGYGPHEGDRLGRDFVAGHLAALSALDARVCLVTDLDAVEEDLGACVLDRIDLLYGVRLGAPDRAWTWELAPPGEAARDRRLVHRVAAYLNWRP